MPPKPTLDIDMAEFRHMRNLMIKVQDKAKEIKNLQDKVLPHLKQQLADTKGLFKGKERKALEVKIKETEVEIADRLDKIPDTLKADGYPDVQVFMRTFREMESVVEQYNRDLAEWEYQVSRKPTAATKEQHRPPERQSVLKHLREIQERNKQQPPQRQYKKSICMARINEWRSNDDIHRTWPDINDREKSCRHLSGYARHGSYCGSWNRD